MQMQQLPPTREYLREILSDFATGELYVVFSYDYEDNILTGMKITGDELRLNDLLKYLRKHEIPILSVKASPVKDEWQEDSWILWWDLLFMKYSNEN